MAGKIKAGLVAPQRATTHEGGPAPAPAARGARTPAIHTAGKAEPGFGHNFANVQVAAEPDVDAPPNVVHRRVMEEMEQSLGGGGGGMGSAASGMLAGLGGGGLGSAASGIMAGLGGLGLPDPTFGMAGKALSMGQDAASTLGGAAAPYAAPFMNPLGSLAGAASGLAGSIGGQLPALPSLDPSLLLM